MASSLRTIFIFCLFFTLFGASQCMAQHKTTYTVKAGETLFGIAKKNDVTVQELKKWNHLKGNNIHVGDKLRIRPASKKSASQRSSTNSKSKQTKSYYIVKSGDSLFRIAQAHNMTVKQLKKLNGLSSNNIHVGQKLALRPGNQPSSFSTSYVASSAMGKFTRHTVKRTQSLRALLKKFEMTKSEFEALNPDVKATSFHRGDRVTILAPASKSSKNPYLVKDSTQSLGNAVAVEYKNGAIGPTTNGELYNPDALTAAAANFDMGTVIFVRNPVNKHGVFVRINDRTTGEKLKLSEAAWKALALTGSQDQVTLFRAGE
jgi:LysM repeat protein